MMLVIDKSGVAECLDDEITGDRNDLQDIKENIGLCYKKAD